MAETRDNQGKNYKREGAKRVIGKVAEVAIAYHAIPISGRIIATQAMQVAIKAGKPSS